MQPVQAVPTADYVDELDHIDYVQPDQRYVEHRNGVNNGYYLVGIDQSANWPDFDINADNFRYGLIYSNPSERNIVIDDDHPDFHDL